MKELSIDEKAKRYDEAIERVENIKTGKCETTFMFTEGLFEHIFPELAESEDEKVRRELLLDIPKVFPHDKAFRYIAYLEKQGEQKDILKDATLDNNEDGLIADIIKAKCEQNPADSYCQEHCKGYQETGKCFIDGECKVKKDAEDKDMLNGLIYLMSREIELNNIDFGHLRARRTLEWLKSLRPQSHWRPSIAQLNALSIVSKGNAPDDIEAIVSLYNDLKKLKG